MQQIWYVFGKKCLSPLCSFYPQISFWPTLVLRHQIRIQISKCFLKQNHQHNRTKLYFINWNINPWFNTKISADANNITPALLGSQRYIILYHVPCTFFFRTSWNFFTCFKFLRARICNKNKIPMTFKLCPEYI